MSVTISITQETPGRSPIGHRGVVSVDPFVVEVPAERLRVGKQLLTPDGWQNIVGTLMAQDTDQVVVWTDERPDDDFPHAEGWKFHFGDPVRTRLRPTAEQQYQEQRRARQARRQARRMSMAAASCPAWCIEHYTGVEGDTCHSGEPLSVDAANVWTGAPIELGHWLERRDRPDGATETVGIIELKTFDDVELTPANLRLLASRLNSLADRAVLHR